MFDVDKFEAALDEYFDCQITLRALPKNASSEDKAQAQSDMENARAEMRARLQELDGIISGVSDGCANQIAALRQRVEPNGEYQRGGMR